MVGKIVFRVDASISIGTGHVMRCLTLAEALKSKGVEVVFICREHEGNLIQVIEQKDFEVIRLGSAKIELPVEKDDLFHAQWLGVTQRQDALECIALMKQIRPDWVVVDHYSIDYRWQGMLRSYCKKIMVIDDLADRKHNCDVLLDQTFGRKEESYKPIVPRGCLLLVGAEFSLLRPEFAKWRDYSLKRRVNPVFKKILVTMGGVDSENITREVLTALQNCNLSDDIQIIVIMGATAPHLESIKQLTKEMVHQTEVKVNVSNMAEIMAEADLAIGAAGATTWERCCLGLPSILVVLAENQRFIADLVGRGNISIILDSARLQKVCEEIDMILSELKEYSQRSAKVTNGSGVSKVVEQIL